MKFDFSKLSLVIILLSFLTCCKTNEKTVYGQWSNGLGTIHFKKDHIFDYTISYLNEKRDQLISKIYQGNWFVSKKNITVNLSDTLVKVFAGCRSFQVAGKLFAEKYLMRNYSCLPDARPAKPLFYLRVKNK